VFLLKIQNEIAASAGAACHADQVNISHVLQAMNVPSEWAMGTLRFSVGRETTVAEIDLAIKTICFALKDTEVLN
jgi:cysteine desulfurase